jgi:hypothetical protein
VRNNQITVIASADYEGIENSKNLKYATDLVSFVSDDLGLLIPIIMGSSIQNSEALPYRFEGSATNTKSEKSLLLKTAVSYLNTPFLSGGKTPF